MFGAFALATGSITVALFAVALAGTGLLTTVGVIVAMDTFGPVADNAQGIAEMSGDVEGAGVDILTELDAVGNTTKAITKGIAIATAVLAATALFGSYRDAINTALADAGVALGDAGTAFASEVFAPNTLVGVIIGASVVFMFSGLAINAVTRAAGAIVFEVRRQFRENPGIMEGTVRPEYGRVVDICTRDSLRELATPGLLAIFAPIAVGFGLGVGPLAGYLAGAIACGTLMAVFLANSGGAWDNAKKLVEDGNHGGKGSPAHEATVIGDTVGDPFKDTAGPSINPLIKVMNLVSVLIAPAVVTLLGRRVGLDAAAADHRAGRRGDHRGRGGRVEAPVHHDRRHPGGELGQLTAASTARRRPPTRRVGGLLRSRAPASRLTGHRGEGSAQVLRLGRAHSARPPPSPTPEQAHAPHAPYRPRHRRRRRRAARCRLHGPRPRPARPERRRPARPATAVPTETDPVAWMDKICTALLPALKTRATQPKLDSGEPARLDHALSSYLGEASTAVDGALNGMAAAGPSPIAGRRRGGGRADHDPHRVPGRGPRGQDQDRRDRHLEPPRAGHRSSRRPSRR